MKKHIIRIVELTTFISFGTLLACAVWCFATFLSEGEPIASAEYLISPFGRYLFWDFYAPWEQKSP